MARGSGHGGVRGVRIEENDRRGTTVDDQNERDDARDEQTGAPAPLCRGWVRDDRGKV
jgi:hypothetical protein